MTISLIRAVESHTGTTGSVSEASYQWALGQAGDSPKGVLVFTMNGVSATSKATAVTYGGQTMDAVSGGAAADTSTEPGNVKAWFLGTGLPTGAQNVVVTRTNDTTPCYAVGFLFGGAVTTRVVGTPVLQQENAAMTAVTYDDGLPSSFVSIVLAGGYTGDNTPAPAPDASSTSAGTLLGSYAYSFGACYETTPTYGSRSRGLAATNDDRAQVVLAVTDAPTVWGSGTLTVADPTIVTGTGKEHVLSTAGSTTVASPAVALGEGTVTAPSASPAYVNSNFTYSGGGPWSVSLTGVTVGNLLVVVTNGRQTTAFAVSSTAGTINTKADGSGDAVWTKGKEQLGNGDATWGADIALWWAYARSSGTHTVSASGSNDMGVMILEYSGVIGSNPIYSTTAGHGFGAVGTWDQTAVVAAADTTIVAAFTEHAQGTLQTFQNSFVERIDNSSATQCAADLAISSPGSYTPSTDPDSAINILCEWVGVAATLRNPDSPIGGSGSLTAPRAAVVLGEGTSTALGGALAGFDPFGSLGFFGS